MATDIEICSNAMLLLGANGIDDFDDGTVEAEFCSNFYERTLSSLLTSRRWTFSIFQEQCAQLVSTPVTNYEYAYQLPSTSLKIWKVYPEHIQYEIFKDKLLYTDYNGEVFVEFTYRVDEADLPEYFAELMEYTLATKGAIPITEDVGKANAMREALKDIARTARLTDAQQRKNVGIKRFPLTQVRGC